MAPHGPRQQRRSLCLRPAWSHTSAAAMFPDEGGRVPSRRAAVEGQQINRMREHQTGRGDGCTRGRAARPPVQRGRGEPRGRGRPEGARHQRRAQHSPGPSTSQLVMRDVQRVVAQVCGDKGERAQDTAEPRAQPPPAPVAAVSPGEPCAERLGRDPRQGHLHFPLGSVVNEKRRRCAGASPATWVPQEQPAALRGPAGPGAATDTCLGHSRAPPWCHGAGTAPRSLIKEAQRSQRALTPLFAGQK